MPEREPACRLRAVALSDPMLSNPSQDVKEVLLWSREELGSVSVSTHLSHTTETSRIKCKRYIFVKKCVRSFIEVRHYL